ncbi:hypothetical protein HCU40_20525 (plasmid) [Pseudanabaena biceps]|nr:hypothetical protein [Pseudanabaena biceps]
MLGHSRASHYQEGLRDRDAGKLPRKKNSVYLEAYLSDRPGGLDVVLDYFPTIEEYIHWKLNHSKSSSI